MRTTKIVGTNLKTFYGQINSMDNKNIIETINYAINDINNGMEESAIQELKDLVKKLEEQNEENI